MERLARIGTFLSGLAATIALIGGVIYFLVSIVVTIHFREIYDQLDELNKYNKEVCKYIGINSNTSAKSSENDKILRSILDRCEKWASP